MADEFNPEEGQSPQQNAQAGLTQQYLQSVLDRKKEAERQMQKLMAALDARRNVPFDPVMMRMAGALLSPTKTGSFGESLGYAATAGAEEAEKQATKGIEFAKLEYELGQKKLEQQKALDALNLRMQFFNKDQPAVGAPASPAGMPAQASVEMSAVPGAIPPAGSAMPEPMAAPPSVSRQLPTGLEGLLISEADPEFYKYLSEEDKRALEERKVSAQERVPVEVGGVKISMSKADFDRMTSAIERGDFDTAKKFYTKYGLEFPFVKDKDGTYKRKTAAEAAREQEIAKGIEPKKYYIPELGGRVEMLPGDFASYRAAKSEGAEALQAWISEFTGGAEAKPTGKPPAEQKPFKTVEELEAQETRRKRVEEEKAKSEVKSRDQFISNAKTAQIIERPAKQIFKIASDPIGSKALGLLENPTIGNAILGATAEGIRVGPFNVGVPAVREAVAKVSGAPEEREKILNSLQMLGRYYSEIELNFTRLYLQGEGAVTEGERAIVRQVSGGVASRRTVALAQTETLMQRAEFDKAVKTELLRWEKANPNKTIDEFTETSNYKRLVSQLESNTDKIYEKYFGSSKPGAAKAEPAAARPASALDDVLKRRGLK